MPNQSNPFATPLTADNAAVVLVDHQTGLFQFLPSVEAAKLRSGVLALAETAKRFGLPVVLTNSWSQGPNGPTMPELVFEPHPNLPR